MARVGAALGSELLEIPLGPFLPGLCVLHFDKPNSQVVTRTKSPDQFDEHNHHGPKGGD